MSSRLSVRYADANTRNYEYRSSVDDFNACVDSGIQELNARFREHGVGYQYEAGELVR